MKRLFSIIVFVLFVQIISPNVSSAQCAMCKATMESNAKSDKSKIGAGLNTGILYLMSIPYIVFCVIGYMWYKNSKKQKVINEIVD